MDNFILAMLCIVTFIGVGGFVWISNEISNDTTGQPLSIGTITVLVAVPVIAQAALVTWVFHPLTFLICMGLVIVMEILTVRTPKGETEMVENPKTRFVSWAFLAFLAEASGIIAGTVRHDAWAFKGGNIPLYFIPFIIAFAIGWAFATYYGSSEEDQAEEKNEVAEDVEAEDFEDAGSVDEIDAEDINAEETDDEGDGLVELEAEDVDDGEEPAA